MEENKNLQPENELQAENVNELKESTVEADTAETLEESKENKSKKEKRAKKAKLLKNQALLKRGSYSLAITAIVIAGVIIFNLLVNVLADRFVLEFDMSTDKINSISEENIDYIKDIKDEVTVTVCADPESYIGGYMSYYAQQYGVTSDATEYYEQTIKLIDRYADYNNKIKVRYLDTQSAEFAEVASKYSQEELTYGDILVSCTKNDNERFKKIGFTDIYSLAEDQTYASYGYTTQYVDGNNIETALTSAISYVTSNETKKIALLTGHSKTDYTESYVSLLQQNNYVVEKIEDSIINNIPREYDAIVIAAPTTDFLGTELDVISDFLENDGNLDKGLVFFADVASPYLTNLYDFLSQWGITVEEGILYETNSDNHMPDEPTTIGSYSSEKDDLSESLNLCITGYNVPLSVAYENQDAIEVTSVVETPETAVIAPKGTAAEWAGASNAVPQSYSTLIQAKKSEYNEENEEITSYVLAFSSVEFIQSAYNEQSSVSNKEITLAAAERAANADGSAITFISKYIDNESFSDKVTEGSVNTMRVIFMIVLPIILIALSIYVYIKRRNS